MELASYLAIGREFPSCCARVPTGFLPPKGRNRRGAGASSTRVRSRGECLDEAHERRLPTAHATSGFRITRFRQFTRPWLVSIGLWADLFVRYCPTNAIVKRILTGTGPAIQNMFALGVCTTLLLLTVPARKRSI
jgi:hypothetical protein